MSTFLLMPTLALLLLLGSCKSILKEISIGETERNDRPSTPIDPPPVTEAPSIATDLFVFSCNRIVDCDVWEEPRDIVWVAVESPSFKIKYGEKLVLKLSAQKVPSSKVGAWYPVFQSDTLESLGWYWSFYQIKPETTTFIPEPQELEQKLVSLGAIDKEGLRWVNKNFSLPKDFIPKDLVDCPADMSFDAGVNLRKLPLEQFKNMRDAAAQVGINLKIISGYRSFASQEKVFQDWVGDLGQAEAEKISAHAGHSEHQLGTTVDLSTPDTGLEPWNKEFASSSASKWLGENAAHYGFVQSYPKGKEEITGYSEESWHFRYVGTTIAGLIQTRGITLEEFFKAELGEAGYQEIIKSWEKPGSDTEPPKIDPAPPLDQGTSADEQFTCEAPSGCNIRESVGSTQATLGNKLGILENGAALKKLGEIILASGDYRHWIKVEYNSGEAYIWQGDY